ncbi:hypothetical protein GIB67_030277 [Kingdonia uniflora]|uniref:Uncharacterized protein n=1 Tax=Kingdonia uniflora TaxID=39325 RepID=A0A7J7M6H9_9MAGN|nr:hypothetical protein GIB67_030277 [Kingdonia uniflora]
MLSYDPNVCLPLWPSPEAAREGIKSIWEEADFIKVSDDEVAFLAHGDANDENNVLSLWYDGFKLLVVIDGKKGRVNGFAVKIVDTTEAGDAFVGDFFLPYQRMKLTPHIDMGIEHLQHALEISPGNVAAYFGLASRFLALKNQYHQFPFFQSPMPGGSLGASAADTRDKIAHEFDVSNRRLSFNSTQSPNASVSVEEIRMIDTTMAMSRVGVRDRIVEEFAGPSGRQSTEPNSSLNTIMEVRESNMVYEVGNQFMHNANEEISFTCTRERNVEAFTSNMSPNSESNSSSIVALVVQEVDMVDEVENQHLRASTEEIPFTYMSSLQLRWTDMKDDIPFVQGKIKCFLTGVKGNGFQFNGRTKFELHVYINDGSLISEDLMMLLEEEEYDGTGDEEGSESDYSESVLFGNSKSWARLELLGPIVVIENKTYTIDFGSAILGHLDYCLDQASKQEVKYIGSLFQLIEHHCYEYSQIGHHILIDNRIETQHYIVGHYVGYDAYWRHVSHGALMSDIARCGNIDISGLGALTGRVTFPHVEFPTADFSTQKTQIPPQRLGDYPGWIMELESPHGTTWHTIPTIALTSTIDVPTGYNFFPITEGMRKLTIDRTLDLEARYLHDESRITHLTTDLSRAEGRLSQLNDYSDGKGIVVDWEDDEGEA